VVKKSGVFLEVHVSFTVELRKYHTNCRLPLKGLLPITFFHVGRDLYLRLGGQA